MALYAAYGSNMDPAQMAERCPHSPQQGTGWLEGWRLTFGGEDIGWEGALATVVEDPAARVFVVLYDVPPLDERTLDVWDGATLGYYRKIKVRVQTLEGDALAWLYVLDAYEGGLPSARYLGILGDAAETAGAPADYVEAIRTRPCASFGGLPASSENAHPPRARITALVRSPHPCGGAALENAPAGVLDAPGSSQHEHEDERRRRNQHRCDRPPGPAGHRLRAAGRSPGHARR